VIGFTIHNALSFYKGNKIPASATGPCINLLR
jgi:hypothetical protein